MGIYFGCVAHWLAVVSFSLISQRCSSLESCHFHFAAFQNLEKIYFEDHPLLLGSAIFERFAFVLFQSNLVCRFISNFHVTVKVSFGNSYSVFLLRLKHWNTKFRYNIPLVYKIVKVSLNSLGFAYACMLLNCNFIENELMNYLSVNQQFPI